jgi:hypothetical protein
MVFKPARPGGEVESRDEFGLSGTSAHAAVLLLSPGDNRKFFHPALP